MTTTSANTVRLMDIRKAAAAAAMKDRLDAVLHAKKQAVCFASAAGDMVRKNQSN